MSGLDGRRVTSRRASGLDVGNRHKIKQLRWLVSDGGDVGWDVSGAGAPVMSVT